MSFILWLEGRDPEFHADRFSRAEDMSTHQEHNLGYDQIEKLASELATMYPKVMRLGPSYLQNVNTILDNLMGMINPNKLQNDKQQIRYVVEFMNGLKNVITRGEDYNIKGNMENANAAKYLQRFVQTAKESIKGVRPAMRQQFQQSHGDDKLGLYDKSMQLRNPENRKFTPQYMADRERERLQGASGGM